MKVLPMKVLTVKALPVKALSVKTWLVKTWPRTDAVIWIVVAAIAVLDLGVTAAGWFRIDWGTLLKPGLTCAALAAGGWIYRRHRPDPRLAAALTGTAQIVAFAAVAAPLSYIAASAAWPLQDGLLAQWDRALGLDWMGLASFVMARPWLRGLLFVAYASFLPQTIVVVVALGFSAQNARLNAFVATFVVTSLITIAISMICPAEGPWLLYGIDATAAADDLPLSHTSWPVFLGLRDGTFNTLSGLGSEGIITFPSLHAALGVVFACALWTVRPLRTIAVILNIALIAATPVEGSHYFADVIAGALIALACWCTMLRLIARDPAADPAIIKAPALVPVAHEAPSHARETPAIRTRASVTREPV